MLTAPKLDYALLAPILIILGAALAGVLVEAFVKQAWRARIQLVLALGAIVISLQQLFRVRNATSSIAAVTSVSIDGVGIFMQGAILVFAFLGILIIADQDNFAPQASALPGSNEEATALQSGKQQTEVFPLTLFAVAGMMIFPIATDFITLFVALEVLSLPLYLMAGLSRRRRLLSQEAALKYFLLGAYSSAFFLFGAALLYGYSGSLSLNGLTDAIRGAGGNDVFLLLGIAFLSVGLLFKVGAVPFHSWTPDVYQGAPTPITGFMAAATKAAAFGATLRIFYVGLDAAQVSWKPIISVIAVITMIVGSVAAISQRDMKRMLAFSSIAHSGFILTAVVSLNKNALSATLFYLLAYGVATIGAFGIVTLVRDSAGEVSDVNRWVGLGKKSPLVASAFSLFLLSFAGIPLTSGFVGKFSIFSAAYESGNIYLVVAGVLSSAIAVFFYLRIILMLFFADATNDSVSVIIPSLLTRISISISVISTIILGVAPSLLLNIAQDFAYYLR
ncbi:NuoN NADH,ubiquinone oxidoreductase subunit 2 (chain N) [actinobacterium SCGC AAA044-D11]